MTGETANYGNIILKKGVTPLLTGPLAGRGTKAAGRRSGNFPPAGAEVRRLVERRPRTGGIS